MERKQFKTEELPITIDLNDILELLYNDYVYARCWRCKTKQFIKDLQLKITQEGWQITCLSCLRRKYLS